MQYLPSPKKRSGLSRRGVNLIIKIALALLFLISGFNFSRSAFFSEYPLFGVHYLAEIMISAVSALFGFYTLPKLLVLTQFWLESTINKTIFDGIAQFLEQQEKKAEILKKEKDLKEQKRQEEGFSDAVLVDTSVLIDGRILEIVKSQFFDKTLIIPTNVIKELQIISDNKDTLKRKKGRRGLDIVKSLKKYVKVIVCDPKSTEKAVDHVLVDFAKTHSLKLLTLDFNLAKVAQVSGIKVLNINILAESLKTVLLPGEQLTIKILQVGKDKNQGVGYLDDGTMVVVKNAGEKIGQDVTVVVSKIIQSPAGRMFFCELATI